MTIAISEPVAELASSTDATSYSLGSFTPAANAILLVFVFAENTVAAGSMTGGGFTWTKKTSIAFNAGSATGYLFWTNTGGSPGSTTITFDCTGDGATACMMMAFEITGADWQEADPIRQVKTASGGTADPSITFDAAMHTLNGYCAAFGLNSNPPSTTPPTGWTEIMDSGVGGGAQAPFAASGAYRAGGETGSTVTFTHAVTNWGMIAAEVAVLATDASMSLGVNAAASSVAAMTMNQSLTLAAAGVAGPASSTIQQTLAAIDALPAVLTAAGVPRDAAVSFAAALQFLVIEPPNTYDSVLSLAAANGLTLAAQSVPQVSLALANALGLTVGAGVPYNSATTLAAQAGIAQTAQQIVQTAVLTGAGLAVLPVADGVFRSVVIGPVGLDALAAAQASPVAQLELIAGMGLTTEAQAGWAAAIAAGIVLAIQQQSQAVAESMITLGATPAQAHAAAVGFQSMLALGVTTTAVASTAFGSPLTGSIVQIINEVYRVSDIQD